MTGIDDDGLAAVLGRWPGWYGWHTRDGMYARRPDVTPPLAVRAPGADSLDSAIQAAEASRAPRPRLALPDGLGWMIEATRLGAGVDAIAQAAGLSRPKVRRYLRDADIRPRPATAPRGVE